MIQASLLLVLLLALTKASCIPLNFAGVPEKEVIGKAQDRTGRYEATLVTWDSGATTGVTVLVYVTERGKPYEVWNCVYRGEAEIPRVQWVGKVLQITYSLGTKITKAAKRIRLGDQTIRISIKEKEFAVRPG